MGRRGGTDRCGSSLAACADPTEPRAVGWGVQVEGADGTASAAVVAEYIEARGMEHLVFMAHPLTSTCVLSSFMHERQCIIGCK